MKLIILGLGCVFTLAAARSAFLGGLTSNNTFFFAGFAVCAFMYGWFYDRLKRIVWVTAVIVSSLASIFGFSLFLGLYGSRSTVTYDEEFLIVLGAGIRDGRIMPPLRKRLEAALRYHDKNPGALIVVSGGQSIRERNPESQVMAQFLIDNGVPYEIILMENESTSTFENLLFTREMLEGDVDFDPPPTAAIVTNDFHMFRSVSFAGRIGFDARSYPAPTPFSSVLPMYPREVAAVIKMWLIGT